MALEAIRARLSLDEQGLLALRIDHGLDWESVAAILSNGDPISPAALRKRFERLKEKLSRLAREQGFVDPDRDGEKEA
jgi:RNA polymerase sigma-70 factor (ECF subfamily)